MGHHAMLVFLRSLFRWAPCAPGLDLAGERARGWGSVCGSWRSSSWYLLGRNRGAPAAGQGLPSPFPGLARSSDAVPPARGDFREHCQAAQPLSDSSDPAGAWEGGPGAPLSRRCPPLGSVPGSACPHGLGRSECPALRLLGWRASWLRRVAWLRPALRWSRADASREGAPRVRLPSPAPRLRWLPGPRPAVWAAPHALEHRPSVLSVPGRGGAQSSLAARAVRRRASPTVGGSRTCHPPWPCLKQPGPFPAIGF